jgi:predicted kinase
MEEIYSSLVKGVRKPIKHKVALFLCGAAGTGKTTSKYKFLYDSKIRTSFVVLNVDDMRELVGSQEKARSALSYATERVIKEGYSFLYDGTCRDKTNVLKMMEHVHSLGYKTILGITYTPLRTALDRISKRVNQPLSEEVARDIYKHLTKNIETYMNETSIDEIYLYNNEHTSKLIFTRKDKTIQCITPESAFYFDVSKYC